MFAELDNAIKGPNGKLENGFWRLMAWRKLAKQRVEDKEELFLDRLASKCLLGEPLFNVPNVLSMSRTFPLMPLFILAVYFGSSPYYAAMGILAVAGMTDWFDGVFARRAKAKKEAETGIKDTSRVGGLIDACSDKGLMLPAFVTVKFLMDPALFWYLFSVDSILLLVAVGTGWLMYSGKAPANTNTDSVGFGKFKLTAQCLGVLVLLKGNIWFGNFLLWISLALAIGSAIGKVWQISRPVKGHA